MEMTTTEVLEGLSTAEVSEDNFNLFQLFLDQSDLVKFAKHIPSEDENEAILNMAYEIVNRTKVLLEEILEEIRKLRPDIVGLSAVTPSILKTARLASRIKDTYPSIPIVIGGPHPSALKLGIFKDFPRVDIGVIGEGEHTFLEIVEDRALEDIKGICYKVGKNEYRINDPRPLNKSLDHIPLSNLDLVDFNENRFVGAKPVAALPSMYVMASRGCPYRCIFCNKSVWGNIVRFRKPQRIIEEIKWLHERYGVKEIFFQDDTFNLNREWACEILSLIVDNGLNHIAFKTPFRANETLVDEELLKLMKDAGFWLVFYGIESGNQAMLDRMKKDLTINEIKRAIKLTHKVGLKTNASFMVGLPGENERTIIDTMNLIAELKPNFKGVPFATPLPDTEFERIAMKKGHILDFNYDLYDMSKCKVRTDELSRNELVYFSRKYYQTIVEKRPFWMPFKVFQIYNRARMGLKEIIAHRSKG